MNERNVSKEYAKILLAYLNKFRLETIDVSFLVGTRKDIIDGLANEKSGVVLKTLDKIAQVFGLTYYEFGNPEHPIPSFEALPERTKKRIAYREKVGPYKEESYNTLDISEKIIIALSLFKENEKFLIEEIVEIISNGCGDKTDTSVIGDRLSKSFGAYVSKTSEKGRSKSGRGRRPYYFKLVRKLPKEMVLIAREVVGDKWVEK